MELVAFSPKKLVHHVYAKGVANAQIVASKFAPSTKFCKFDPNVEMFFQIEALEDKAEEGGGNT